MLSKDEGVFYIHSLPFFFLLSTRAFLPFTINF